MIRAHVTALADRLDEVIDSQQKLLAMVKRQRPEIVAGRHAVVDAIAGEIETEVRRLSASERARGAAAEALADALGIAATRWSALREALDPFDRATIAPRIERIEVLVRELEMANAVNGQLVRQELELLDLSVRSLGAPDPRVSHRAYTAGGARANAPATGPVLLNTAA
jgi:flagellar biosynthesis/type III secretory pathway chaperone